jgi:HJR/Mrr/RecB family endonuclease
MKILKENGIPIKNKNDIYFLLYHYIEKKEDKFMLDSISHKANTFSILSGTDFETLLYRLYVAMGYSVRKTGKTGDQGCDLVVNMGDQRTVVQAKCYNGSVGNAAVQQAMGRSNYITVRRR